MIPGVPTVERLQQLGVRCRCDTLEDELCYLCAMRNLEQLHEHLDTICRGSERLKDAYRTVRDASTDHIVACHELLGMVANYLHEHAPASAIKDHLLVRIRDLLNAGETNAET